MMSLPTPPLPNKQPLQPAISSNSAADEKNTAVQVVVRCRPPSDQEKRASDPIVVGVHPGDREVRLFPRSKAKEQQAKTYTFDATYGALSTQEEVYNQAVKPLVEEVLAGFNCTVFAYGQTGTGKTYTMEGELTSDSAAQHAGVIPRSIHTIFETLEKAQVEYSVKVSFLELYNEELADLLSDYEEKPGEEKKELRIFEDVTGKKGMLVSNLEEVIVTNADQVFVLLQKANKNRKVAETNLNAKSSRSHYVFTITVHTKEYNEDGEDIIKSGKLYLVDLAGSECIGKSGAQNQRAKEAGKINQSLLTLGRVITALVDRSNFIPYRDSKLTRLLQESLGGRAKTVIIATVSPSSSAFDETVSTLDYAHRAKSIKNKPQVNQKMTKRAYMKELLNEINSLKRDNEVLRSKNGIIIPPEKYERMLAEEKGKSLQVDELIYKLRTVESTNATLQEQLDEKENLLKHEIEEKNGLQLNLNQTIELLESTKSLLQSSQENLRKTKQILYRITHQLYESENALEETQVIVAEHQKTENQLYSTANTLLSTLDSTIDSKNALHSKIDRKTQVEQHNAAMSKQFESKMKDQYVEEDKVVQKFAEKQLGLFDEMKSTVLDNQQQKVNEFNSLTQQLDVDSTEFAVSTAAIQASTQSFHDGHISSLSAASTHHQSTLAASRTQLQQWSSVNQQQFSTIVSGLKKHDDIRSQHESAVYTMLKSSQDKVDELVVKSNAECEVLKQKQIEQSQLHVLQFQQQDDKLNSFLQQQQAVIDKDTQMILAQVNTMSTKFIETLTSMQTNFLSSITQFMNEFQTKTNKSIADTVESMKTQIQFQIVQQNKEQQVLNESVESLIASNTQFQAAHTAAYTDDVASVESAHVQMRDEMNQIQSKLDESNTAKKQYEGQVYNSIEQEISKTQEFQSQQLQSVDSFTSSHTEQLNALNSQFTTIVQAKQQWVSDATTTTDNQSNDMIARVASVTAALSDYTTVQSAIHANHLNHLSGYISNDLRADLPTGTTPQKLPIAKPSADEIQKTKSPNTIISQYRAENPRQPIILEGLEEYDEEKSSEPSNNVTPAVAPIKAPTPPVFSLNLSEIRKASDSVPASATSSKAPSPLTIVDDVEDEENVKPTPTNVNVKPSSGLVKPTAISNATGKGLKAPTPVNRFGFAK